MFYVKENLEQKERVDKLHKIVKKIFGFVPPQAKFLGDIEADYLQDYITMAMRIARQESIDRDFFTFIRVHIAYREDFEYCKGFNTQVLLKNGYSQEAIDSVVADIANIPLDKNHKVLAKFAIKAIYNHKECSREDFEEIYKFGWSQKEVFDAIEHAGTLLRNGRILSAYREK